MTRQHQQDFFKPPQRDHGGSLGVGRRRSRRPLSTRQPLHITLRSDLATGPRALLKHKPLVRGVMKKAQRLFRIRVYEYAICGNHLHLIVKGYTRVEIQNFFRVFAGHLAQGILKACPLKRHKTKAGRKFWALLLYSRVITWGREFKRVKRYLIQNTLEALFLVAYRPRVPH